MCVCVQCTCTILLSAIHNIQSAGYMFCKLHYCHSNSHALWFVKVRVYEISRKSIIDLVFRVCPFNHRVIVFHFIARTSLQIPCIQAWLWVILPCVISERTREASGRFTGIVNSDAVQVLLLEGSCWVSCRWESCTSGCGGVCNRERLLEGSCWVSCRWESCMSGSLCGEILLNNSCWW